MKHRIIRTVPAICIAALLTAGSVSASPAVLRLDSGAEKEAGFIAIDEIFKTAQDQVREVVMTGLKEGNKDLLLACLEENYRETKEPVPLKIIDEAFCDAEKWDNTDEHAYYDTLQCWAASAANMLWMSGWTEYLEYPEGMQPFSSEDEIFRLYNNRFSDRGGDIDRALDWFFMGEFFVTGIKKSTVLIDPEAQDGFKKDFVSSLAQKAYDLTENTEDICRLLKIGPADAGQMQGRSVFQGSTGALVGGELIGSGHSVTIAGVITDPAEELPQNKFKAVIIIDSDNDGVANEEEKTLVQSITAEEEETQEKLRNARKGELKAARPNSCTVYPLNYIRDINGTACWEIVGYADPEEEHWEPEILFSISELPLPSDTLIESLREESGSLDHMNDPDFTLDTIFMTGNPQGYTDPYIGRILQDEDAYVTEFAYGQAIRMNYFVSDRSRKGIEKDAPEEECPCLSWKVTRDSDGTVAAEGTHRCELPVMAGYEGLSDEPDLITLNEIYGQILPWDPGDYIVTAELNKDHAVRESYYKNNLPQTLKFTINPPPAD